MMETLFVRIRDHAEQRPHHLALADGAMHLDYRELLRAIERTEVTGRRVGLLLANSCAFAVLDLALLSRGIVCVPIPSFFSDAQLDHLARDAGLDTVITDQAPRIASLANGEAAQTITVAGYMLGCFSLQPTSAPALPHGTIKITYTSGTTGEPKGVCLTAANIERVVQVLCVAVHAHAQDQSLALLPLSTLLANIANLYAPLTSGGTAWVPDLAQCGMSGSVGVSRDAFIAALQRYQPTVTVLVPHLLKVVVEAVALGADWPRALRFIAVGGAPISAALLAQARRLGLPVYQGYGLSEAASVVSLNLPDQRRIGSVGRPLPHMQIRIADDGEVIVRGNLFAGYLRDPTLPREEWSTGDLGYLNVDGYLYLTGRKKTAYATAHGRKLAPEWVESVLTVDPAIAQAAMFGEGRSFNIAIIVPSDAAAVTRIDSAITAANLTLPDYARVTRWVIADEPFSQRNGLANGAGVIKRAAIATKYACVIARLYEREERHAIF